MTQLYNANDIKLLSHTRVSYTLVECCSDQGAAFATRRR